jgi:hypothetical protein
LTEVEELKDNVGYPFRASLEGKARCFYCKNFTGIYAPDGCLKGHEVQFPLVTNEHHCRDYYYNKRPVPIKEPKHPECSECAYWYFGCSGIKWLPYKDDPKCEFFHHKNEVCKNAIPMLQYGCNTRNNYCKLPPHLRDGDSSRGWKWVCPNAHTPHVQSRKCYKPVIQEKERDN